MPEISIIVPVYNVEKYIKRCIDSILAQTFSDFELILVDDGSKDASGKICDGYAEKDARIRVLHQKNGGVSAARNAALELVRGRYVMFADSDDFVHAQWCERMHAAIVHNPDAWINCNMASVTLQGEVCPRMKVESCERWIPTSVYALYRGSIAGSPCNKIYDAEIIRSDHLRFNETYKIGEDTDFNMRYYKHCKNPLLIAEPLYSYYQNEESASHTYRYDSFDLYRHTYFDRLPYIEEEYMDEYLDDWLWRFLNMLEQVFDPRNTMSWWRKMRYCNQMMHTPEFGHCVSHAPGKSDGPLLMRVLKTKSYYVYWAFQKLYKMKKAIKG